MKLSTARQCIGTSLFCKSVICCNLHHKKPFANSPHILEGIYHPSLQTDCDSYASLLRACTCSKALSQGQLIHDHIIKTGFECNAYLNNLIIDMYGHCEGCLPVAESLFVKMAHRDHFSWNFIIRSYTHWGLYFEALQLFQRMLGQGETADQHIYVSLLTVCASIKSLEHGKQLHIYILWSNYESETIVATALINMYGKCGRVVDAWPIFNTILVRDVIFWNTIIATCVQYGYVESAIQLVKRYHEEGELANKDLILTTLDAYSNHGALLECKHLHACLASQDWDTDLMVQAAISNMYAKCRNVRDIQRKPFTTKCSNCLLQNGQITRTGQGPKDETLELLKSKGLPTDNYSLASMISACASQAAFLEGEQIHGFISGTTMVSNVVVAAALINLYGKSGKLSIARTLFDSVPIHDVVSWTAMISAYAQNGESKEAICLYKRMKLKGIEPNKMTFTTVLDACTFEDSIAEGRHVHEEISGSVLESDIFVGTALVNMYGKFGSFEEAAIAFDKIVDRDVVAWNALISTLAHNAEGVRALQCLRQMQEEGTLSNKVTIVSSLNACATYLALMEGKRIHAQVVAKDLEFDVLVGTALIHIYSRCTHIEEARSVFCAIPNRDIILWTAMTAAYAHCGQVSKAFELFTQMLSEGVLPDKISCISILSACVTKTGIDDGRQMHMWAVFCGLDLDECVVKGLITMYVAYSSMDDAIGAFKVSSTRNRDMYVSILSACAKQFYLLEGRRVHRHVVQNGLELEVPVGNALINMYSKCGILQEAQVVFERMGERDIVSWTVMIMSHAHHGQGDYACHLFNQIQLKGLFPNKVTFLNILNAFAHAGMVEEGFQYFGYACQAQSTVSPVVDHYNIIVDLLGKAGRLSEAEDLIRRMPCTATACTWTSLLDACRYHTDVERGERTAEHVLRIKHDHPAPYITMYNMYTAMQQTLSAG